MANNSVDSISSSPEDIKPIVNADKGRSSSNTLSHSSSPVLKGHLSQDMLQTNQPFSDYSRLSSLHIPNDNKTTILPPNSSDSVSCSAQSHLKLPSARAMHMDMRYSPYSRPAYPMGGIPAGFLPHTHAHMYPTYSVPQPAYPSCQVGQSYPSCTASQQSFGYPVTVSSASMIGLANGNTSSELSSTLDLHGTVERTLGVDQRTT